MTKDYELGPKERKSFPFSLLEEKGVDLEEGTFQGFAAVTGNFDGHDIIDRGAFKKTLKEMGDRVKIFWIHDFHMPIGKPEELEEVGRGKLPQALLDRAPDATGGLWVKGRISNTTYGKDALTLMKDGVLNEMSIGFDPVKEEMADDGPEGISVRHLKEIRLYDVSPVPLAMNPAAIVLDVKEANVEEEKEFIIAIPSEEGKHEGHSIVSWEEAKPYPNEHSCRLEDPGKYDTCRRGKRTADKPDSVKGKEYVVIYCKKEDGPMEQQAFRYPKDSWTAAEGKAHCEYNKGSFEAAREEEPKGVKVNHCDDCNTVVSYSFEKNEGWTSEKARTWIAEQGKAHESPDVPIDALIQQGEIQRDAIEAL